MPEAEHRAQPERGSWDSVPRDAASEALGRRVHRETPMLAEQFDSLEQQREAANLGMWAFLGTEILMFGGLFTCFAVYRALYPDAFKEVSAHLYLWIGVANTAVLLTSSFFVALAVHAVKESRSGGAAGHLLAAIGLGVTFLILKVIEYYLDIKDGLLPWHNFHFEGEANPQHARLFMVFYWFMTGLHAVHMVIGIAVLSVIAFFAWRQRYSAHYYTPVEISGLYWHFVDIVWIFLLPTLYLAQPSGHH